MARTGNDGGLYALLKALAKRMAEEYAQREIGGKVSHHCAQRSSSELLADANEYLEKYGNLLPGELTEKGAGRIKSNIWKVWEEHPRLIQRLQQVGR